MISINSKQIKVAKRYAKALSELASSNVVLDELLQVRDVVLSSSDLREFCSSPIVSTVDKKELLNEVFSSFSEYSRNFLNLLIDENRFGYIETIVDEFRVQMDLRNNLKRVKVISAVEMIDDEKNRLVEILTRKLDGEILCEHVVDESIIGGLIIKIDDKVIDDSLKTRFKSMKQQVIK